MSDKPDDRLNFLINTRKFYQKKKIEDEVSDLREELNTLKKEMNTTLSMIRDIYAKIEQKAGELNGTTI